jgi:fatty-acyl-CoA synthase
MTLVSNTELTPLMFLERSAWVFPDTTAVIYGKPAMTCRQLAGAVTGVARALRASGIRPGTVLRT